MQKTALFTAAAAGLAATGLAVGAWFAMGDGDAFAECGGGLSTGVASIGGPFTLVSETGETVTEADVIDKPTFLYFGFTFCPDVCPIDAAIMAQVAADLRSRGHEVNTVFVSVDPARDTPEALAAFTDNLDPDMLGLTGTAEQVAAAAKAYRVYYQKADGDDPDYYLVDHSAFTYFMDPDRGFLTIFRNGDAPDAMAETAACYLDALAGS